MDGDEFYVFVYVVHTGGWCFRGWFSITATKRDWASYNEDAKRARYRDSDTYSDERRKMSLDVSITTIQKYRSAFCAFLKQCITTQGVSASKQCFYVTSLVDLRGGTRSLIKELSVMNICLPLSTWDSCRKKMLQATKEKLR